jgi:putative ABC transport system substrate-binding protein
VIYDPARSSDLIALARSAADSAGIRLVTRTVSDPEDVPEGLRDLIEQTDALWLLPDSTCFTRESFEFALKLSLERKVPTMVFAEAYVRAGALMALSPDYARVGRQVARLVRRVLAGEAGFQAEPASPDAASLVINGRTARYLGIEIAPAILERAERVFE